MSPKCSEPNDVNINQLFNPTIVDKIFQAKAVYGQLFLFRGSNIISVFRPLTTKECETIISLSTKLNEVVIEDWIFRTTFITSNKDIDFLLNKTPYLYVKHIAGKLLLLSNYQEEKDFKKALYQQRGNTKTLQSVMEVLIAKAYTSLSYDDIKNMTQTRQLELLSKAEVISGEALQLDERGSNRKALRRFAPGAEVIGGDLDFTSPDAADKPDFNETF